MEDPYQSVNEGTTTDTSITTDAEGAAQLVRGAVEAKSENVNENEGIASSDQDEDHT